MEKKGSVIGGSLLITGSCVGAGMLGLPILTGVAGLYPTLFMFLLACFFMTASALLVVEVNQWFHGKVNFITMISNLLGPLGKASCIFLYLFLFYALLVAYIAGSGHHVSSLLGNALPIWIGSLFFVLLFGWIVYLGTTSVDLTNRCLMFVKIIAYVALISFGFQYIEPSYLTRIDLKYSFFSLPILVISFGFHNMIPTLSHYLEGDIKRIRLSILCGALFTLLIYLFWEIIALGSLPLQGEHGILSSYKQGIDAAEALKNLLHSSYIGLFAAVLAFLAILTSFLAQTLSIVHFLSDGMKISHKKRENLYICMLALLPPLIFAIIQPDIFYAALNFAGGICAVILFGIFPVLMVWRGRYNQTRSSSYQVQGGKPLLYALFLIALFILSYQLSSLLGFHLFPTP
jgi:tyrosine-specific transport protein